jgi:hypothetical protein
MAYPELRDANKATTFNSTSQLYEDLVKEGTINPVTNNNPQSTPVTSISNPVSTATPTTTTTTTTTTTFVSTTDAKLSDIKGHWAQGSIQKLIDKNYITGYPDGYFLPNKSITRAEFIKILISALGVQSNNSAAVFSDTKTHWAKNEIAIAKDKKITEGYKNGTFKPNANITRAEIVSMLSNAKKFPEKATTKKFNDVKKGHWAESAIYAAAANGVVSGYPGGLFKPNSEATRAEACSMINEFLTNIK